MSLSRMYLLHFLPKNLHLSHCGICPKSKQTRLSFPKVSLSKSSSLFELVHMDIWGPFRTSTYNGEKYFLTIVDDFSRGTWVYLMQSKFDIFRLLTQFFTMINTQFSLKVKVIRTDNALDFFKHECASLFASLGVLHQSSCPFIPQQNGIVERKHHHILNLARSLHFQSSIPLHFWEDCVLTAVYLINRTPSPLISNKNHLKLSLGNLLVMII